MSGMRRSTGADAAAHETADLKSLLLNVDADTPAAGRTGDTSPSTARAGYAHTPHDTPVIPATQEELFHVEASQQQQPHTPVQRRTPAPYTLTHNDRENYHSNVAVVDEGPTPPRTNGVALTGPSGLVHTTRTSPSADAMARSPVSDTSAAPRAGTGGRHNTHVAGSENPRETASLVVGGVQWQAEFAAHTQQILRETHKQVEVLREYQVSAARERQRADQLAEARRALESKLATAEQRQRQEERRHADTVGELSRQVLELDEAVAAWRRMHAVLEGRLEAAQNTAVAQRAAQEAAIAELTQRYECQLTALRSEHQQREATWSDAQARLVRLPQEQSQGVSPDTGAVEPQMDLTSLPTAEPLNRGPSIINSNDSVRAPMFEETPSDAVVFTRVHPDVLAQQQLREQTLTSQLSLLEARLQREVAQRRLAEERVTELLAQNEELREAAAGSPRGLHHDEHSVEHDNGTGKTTTTQQQQQQAVLHEIQVEYKALQKESRALQQRHAAQQRQWAEQWAAVCAHLLPLLDFAGINSAAFADGATDSHVVVAALQTLMITLREQKRADAVTNTQEREAVRLAALEQALQQADQENSEHRVALEVVEAQLRGARDELAEWQQQQQQQLLRRQQRHDDEWRAAAAHFNGVVAMLQRALREYTQPLSTSHTADGNASSAAGPARSPKRTTKASKPMQCVSATQPVAVRTSSMASAEHLNAVGSAGSAPVDLEGSMEEKEATTPTTAAEVEVAAQSREHVSAVMPGATPRRSAQGVVREDDQTPAGGDDDTDDLNVSALSVSSKAIAAAVEGEEAEVDAAPAMAHLADDMKRLGGSLWRLLAAWRTRQHTLLESRKHWKQKAQYALATNAALREKHQARERQRTLQIRLLRSAEQHHTQELEELKRDWAAALEQQAAQHAHEVTQLRDTAARERADVLARLHAADEKARRAEGALVTADTNCSLLKTTVRQLQDAQESAVTRHEQAQRRQSDLNIHIEDLEGCLREAQQVEVCLRALLIAATGAMVRLMLALQQLRYHYAVLHALHGNAEYLEHAVEHILCALNTHQRANDDDAAVATPAPSSFAPHSGASMFLLMNSPVFPAVSRSAARFRAAVYAVTAMHRMQRLLQLSKTNTPPATASRPSSPLSNYQSLISAFASYGVPTHAHFGASEGRSVGQADGVLPAVRLPETPELVGPLLPLLRLHEPLETPHAVERQRQVCFEASEREVGSRTAAAAATVAVSTSLLGHLLSVAQVDVHAPSTSIALAGVHAAANVKGCFQHAAQQTQRCRSALRRMNAASDTGAGTLLDSVSSLLPPALAAPLRQLSSTSSLRARHLREVQAVVQRLVEQNRKLVSAVETQAQLGDARGLEMDSLNAQLLLAPQQQELMSLQERVVQSRASLLHERQLRRAAEDQLAQLRQEQLQWIGEAEHLQREVYALNMELANLSTDAAHHPHPSVLSIQREGDEEEGAAAATAGAGSAPAREAAHAARPCLTSSPSVSFTTAAAVRAGAERRTPPQRSPVSPCPLGGGSGRSGKSDFQAAHEEGADMRGRRSLHGNDDEAYYHQLLHGVGGGPLLTDAADAGRSGRAPLRYQQRHNIPTAEELAQQRRASPRLLDGARDAAAMYAGHGSGVDLFVPKVVQEQQQRQTRQQRRTQAVSVAAGSVTVEDTARGPQHAPLNSTCGRGPASVPSTPANIRMVIAPSQTTHNHHHNHHNSNSSGQLPRPIVEIKTSSPSPLQAPPSIPAETSVSTPPPQRLRDEGDEDESHSTQKDNKKPDRQTAVALANGWAPSCASPLSAIQSAASPQPGSPPSATAFSAQSHRDGFVASGDGSARSARQPPPPVRLSLSGHLHSSTALTSPPPRQLAAANQEGRSRPVSGPTYFTPRSR
ncbi:hypothetical protein ABB37_09043 [Leptomonas pyrrhocoris]|uniref:Uncharacterized protein n=1 Tax=Leptomonas pyrrhocoris TaxID=157538 RepID=A0A0M9FRV1_LEPPY|nr:hypothetical protein ABB37_09043 [Leptomonas pyrrhocoris]KPA74743.1 hypothetical protein ABB37_09043 [Leptomonas pyrrhocoris]|eukprot:XP_015653182.1 hypothetical protein ABB37_09043 [Leptomonas pyrrhocoris]